MVKKFKITDIGSIPVDWDIHELGSVASYRRGSFPQPYGLPQWYDENNGMPFVQVFDVDDNMKLKPETKQKISEVAKSKSVFVPEGAILLTIQGSIGRIAITQYQSYVDRTLLIFQSFKRPIDKSFFKYVVHQLFQIEKAKAPGGTIKTITKAELSRFYVPLPPTKAEQTAIATALNDADSLIQQLEQLLAKKRNIKTGAMQELLKPKEGWVRKKLGELAVVRDGTHQTPKYVKQGVPFYSVENVTADEFVNTKFISPKEHAFLTKNWKIERGDILMTRIGSIGVCKYVDWEVDASFYVSLALLKIHATVSARFICQYSQFDFFKKELELNSLQFAYPQKINLGQISKVKLIIPPTKAEQDRIAKILFEMDADIRALEKKIAKYKMVKQGMMQVLLTGKIRLL